MIGFTLIALTGLCALFLFITFVDDLGSVGRGNYSLWEAVKYHALITPRLAFALLPVAAVIGSLMGLGQLATRSELTVMRAAGISGGRLVGAVMKAAFILILVAIVIGEVVAPFAERYAQQLRTKALGEVDSSQALGFWIREGKSFVNIRQVVSQHELGRVFVYQFDDEGHLVDATQAASATFDEQSWRLHETERTRFAAGTASTATSPSVAWGATFAPDLVDTFSMRPEAMAIAELLRHIEYLRRNELTTASFELALWTKILYPVATAVMVFLAVPMVLGRLGSVSVGQRVLIGAMLGVTFHIVHQTFGHAGLVYGLNAVVCAVLPTLVFFLLAVVLMWRVDRA